VRSAEDLYGTYDDNHDITEEEQKNCAGKHPTGTTDSDCDGVSDFDEIYRDVPVTITNHGRRRIVRHPRRPARIQLLQPAPQPCDFRLS
jgi:hypothetical protein